MSLKLLLVEDDRVDSKAVRRILKETGLNFEVHEATDGASALQRLQAESFDSLLLDYRLPDMDGIEFMKKLAAGGDRFPVPVIMLTGHGSETLAVEAMHHGAQDYLPKDHVTPTVLRRAIGNAVAMAELRRKEQRAQEELIRSNEELQQFAYVASHDLQEPLRKIVAFGDRLKARYGEALGEQGRDYLERMQSAAGRMQKLIEGLLGLSRVNTRTEPFVEVDLNRVVREVVSDLELRVQQAGGSVEVGELPVVEADPTQIRQLLQNLVGNALKFHAPERAPVVKVYSEPLPSADHPPAKPSAANDYCRIMVEDNGIGIGEQYLKRIFAPFERLHSRSEYEGTGIGLAICHRIVKRHGGSIDVESTPDRSTTFIVTLPLRQTRNVAGDREDGQ